MSSTRRAKITFCGQPCGELREIGTGPDRKYEFEYCDSFLKSNYRPLSLNLPKLNKIFLSSKLFGIFEGLAPEGKNREAQARANGTSPDDLFTLITLIGKHSDSAIKAESA